MPPATVLATWVAIGVWGMCGQAPAAIPRPIVTLRVFAHAMMDVPALEQATSTAGRLLESAGIGIEWRNCDGVQETCAQPDTAT